MRALKDEEIVRLVMSDSKATPLERELAYRVHRLTVACEAIEEVIQADIFRGETWHGTTH